MALSKRNTFLLFLFIILQYYSFAQQKLVQSGVATYYSDYFQGRKTASGETYDKALYTAAHPSLPFQTFVKITNLVNNKFVIVKINDRCPFYYSRVIDLSKAAAAKIEMVAAGRVKIKLEEITPSDLNIISQKPDVPDTTFKWTFPDSLSMKDVKTSGSIDKNKNGKIHFVNNQYSLLPPNRFMIKPEEVGFLISGNGRFKQITQITSCQMLCF